MKDDEVNITDDHSSFQRGLRYLLDGETKEKAHEDIVHQEVHAHLHICGHMFHAFHVFHTKRNHVNHVNHMLLSI